MKGISVVICCYNSAASISDTLQHLILQAFNTSLDWEIVLVDNNCTDDTVIIAKKIFIAAGLADEMLVIIKEPKPGLSEARYAGVTKAKYACIVFCDDDNWLSSDYLQTAFSVLDKDESIGVIGGMSIAVTDGQFPEWWNYYKESFAVGEQSDFSGDISSRRYVWGAGMVTRRELYLKCFPPEFPSLLKGRTNNNLNSGDDAEFCARLLMIGYRIQYQKTLILEHFISKKRLTDEYLKKMMEGHKASYEILKKYYAVIDNQQLTFLGKIKKTFSTIRNLKKSALEEIFFIWTARSLYDQEINQIYQFTLISKV